MLKKLLSPKKKEKKEVKKDNGASVRYTKQSLFFNKEYNVDLEKAPKIYKVHDRLMPDKVVKEERVHRHPRSSFIILCSLVIACSFFIFPALFSLMDPPEPVRMGPPYEAKNITVTSNQTPRQGPPYYEEFLPAARKPDPTEEPAPTPEPEEILPTSEPAPEDPDTTVSLEIGGVDYSFSAEKIPGYKYLMGNDDLSSIPIPKPTENPDKTSPKMELNIQGKDYSFTLKSIADLFSGKEEEKKEEMEQESEN